VNPILCKKSLEKASQVGDWGDNTALFSVKKTYSSSSPFFWLFVRIFAVTLLLNHAPGCVLLYSLSLCYPTWYFPKYVPTEPISGKRWKRKNSAQIWIFLVEAIQNVGI
jgi:hypothetical protein